MTTVRNVIAKAICSADPDGGGPCICDQPACQTPVAMAEAVLADLLSAPESVRLELAGKLNPWHPLPLKDTWLRTKREGEDGENVCMLPSYNDEEWIERDGGRTTVTHFFAAPTHWVLPAPPSEDK